jgi:hypothetical protein
MKERHLVTCAICTHTYTHIYTQGGTIFVDVGTATCIGSPIIEFTGIAGCSILGEFVAVNGACGSSVVVGVVVRGVGWGERKGGGRGVLMFLCVCAGWVERYGLNIPISRRNHALRHTQQKNARTTAGLLVWIGGPFVEYSGIEWFRGECAVRRRPPNQYKRGKQRSIRRQRTVPPHLRRRGGHKRGAQLANIRHLCLTLCPPPPPHNKTPTPTTNPSSNRTTGLGGTVYVGTGAGVFGYSPLVEAIGIANDHKDYWIQARVHLPPSRRVSCVCVCVCVDACIRCVECVFYV